MAPRSAYSEIKRYAPTIAELTSRKAVRPFFDSEERVRGCPYCNAAKRWHARLDTYSIEGGKLTDVPRRALFKALQKKAEHYHFLELKSDRRSAFFEWLDTLRISVDFEGRGGYLNQLVHSLSDVSPRLNGRKCSTVFAQCDPQRACMKAGNATGRGCS